MRYTPICVCFTRFAAGGVQGYRDSKPNIQKPSVGAEGFCLSEDY